MSLINQMLRDLERQRKSDRPSDDPDWPAVQNRARPRRRLSAVRIGAILVVFVLGGWAAGYFFLETERPVSRPAQTARAKVPPTSPVAPTESEQASPALPGGKETLAAEDFSRQPGPPATAADAAGDSASPAPALPEPPPVPVASQRPEPAVPPRKDRRAADTVVEPPPGAEPSPRPPVAKAQTATAGISPGHGKIKKTAPPPTPEEQAERYFRQGAADLDKGRVQAAEHAFDQALDLLPTHHRAREQLALLLLVSGRIDQAGDLLRKGLVLAPGHVPFRQASARISADRGHLEEALSLLSEDPVPPLGEAPDYHALTAALQQRLGHHGKAAEIYGRLITFNPRVGAWWFGLAAALEHIGASTEARRAYQSALQRPDLAPALRGYARDRLQAMALHGK